MILNTQEDVYGLYANTIQFSMRDLATFGVLYLGDILKSILLQIPRGVSAVTVSLEPWSGEYRDLYAPASCHLLVKHHL